MNLRRTRPDSLLKSCGGFFRHRVLKCGVFNVLACILAAAICLTSCGGDSIPDETAVTSVKSGEVTTAPPATTAADGTISAQLYGSYLTMYQNNELDGSFPYAKIFHSYKDIEDYFYPSERYFMFGRRFTIACAEFTDDYFASNDVMMIVINEPSTYASYSLDSLKAQDGGVNVQITRHLPQDAPTSNDIVYHLIITAPKGSFDGIDQSKLTVDITQVTDAENTDVFDAERFRYLYPEFWPATYPANALIENPHPVIDSIQSYDELLGFYETYKDDFDLDEDFLRYIGPVYDEAMFNDYVLLLAVLPFDGRLPEPSVSELFVYNLQIYISVENLPEESLTEYTRWYLLAIAVSKNDLDGVNLTEFNIG